MTEPSEYVEGMLLWEPDPEVAAASELRRYMRFLGSTRGLVFDSYDELWRWSVTEPDPFWTSICEFFGVRFERPPTGVLSGQMPSVTWFSGATVNYAEHALQNADQTPALLAINEAGGRTSITYAELRQLVARCRTGLAALGVERGDRVAALLPNGAEAVIAFLACASLGAIWSACAPEFGVPSVLDRFRQIEPKVLIAVDGYRYGGKLHDRTAELQAIRDGLPSLSATVVISQVGSQRLAGERVLSFDELLREHAPLSFTSVPFDHPLWILYSSGTTGLPKPIVQGHGGILLEHAKALRLHCDLKPGDRFFWFTTTGWMMWNFLVSGLLAGCTLVLYDGSPAYPDLLRLWRLAADESITFFGTSAPYLLACKKALITPKDTCALGALRAIGTTGAPLPVDGFGWVYEAVSRKVLLGSLSGGTDVCTAFVLCCPLLPVHAGEIQCRGLGAKVEAFDEQGQPVVDRVGELVVTLPLPSMPVGFWGDQDGSRYRDSYFAVYEGVWRHGDWIKITTRGSCVIYGRSDSTLNRAGVRMGTSEFYRVIEGLPEIMDSLVVDTGSLADQTGKLWLFIALRPGGNLDAALEARIRETVRRELSPRHVPDEIRAVPEVPRTLNGKKVEVPIKRILSGVAPDRAVSRDTLANPGALDVFIELARRA